MPRRALQVFCSYGDTWSLEEFEKLVRGWAEKIPDEALSTARVVFDRGSDYDGGYSLTCVRSETHAEMSAREAVEELDRQARAIVDSAAREAAELREYERLRRKYGDGGADAQGGSTSAQAGEREGS